MNDHARRSETSSEYMLWAKTRSHARFNLASSGLMNYTLAELPVRLEDLELSGPSYYGYAPLQEALAAKCGVPTECVVAAQGTSLANHLAMAAVLEPGDEVLTIARHTISRHLSLKPLRAVEMFERRALTFSLYPGEVERRISRARDSCLTNSTTFRAAAPKSSSGDRRNARVRGARGLVDEVTSRLFERSPPSAFHLVESYHNRQPHEVYADRPLCGWSGAPRSPKGVVPELFVRRHPRARGGAPEPRRARQPRRHQGGSALAAPGEQASARLVPRLARRAGMDGAGFRHGLFPTSQDRRR